ncbi:YceI family protein [Solirhodobacter olei]|uniref:YceI family protein n=1 Tax=Solirhodobacter olei TaxID=2493082 RepID=UPI000FDB8047|nr:YceI family protein [Solirhodobacter olei]
MRPALPKTLLAAAFVLIAGMASAMPRHYALEPATTAVRFSVAFGGDKITGQMPVAKATVTLDFQSLANCHVSVTLDAAKAEASFPFAAQAMKGPLVLDTRKFPDISFTSTAVHATATGALIDGRITIRGQTRPIRLTADLYRQRGTAPGELDHLAIQLTGEVKRSEFGATGWAGTVGDVVHLDIIANMDRRG